MCGSGDVCIHSCSFPAGPRCLTLYNVFLWLPRPPCPHASHMYVYVYIRRSHTWLWSLCVCVCWLFHLSPSHCLSAELLSNTIAIRAYVSVCVCVRPTGNMQLIVIFCEMYLLNAPPPSEYLTTTHRTASEHRVEPGFFDVVLRQIISRLHFECLQGQDSSLYIQ